MSQAAPADVDPSSDITPPPTQDPQNDPDSPQDVTASPLVSPPESSVLPQPTEETTTKDNTAETNAAEVQTEQPKPQGQLMDCDQPVSLEAEAEAADENEEVCAES